MRERLRDRLTEISGSRALGAAVASLLTQWGWALSERPPREHPASERDVVVARHSSKVDVRVRFPPLGQVADDM